MVDKKTVDCIVKALAKKTTRDEIYLKLLLEKIPLDTIEQSYVSALNAGQTTSQDGNSDVYASPNTDSHTKAVSVIVIFAALLVAAGIFSFVASNWQYLGDFTKVAIILSAMCGVYGLGYLAQMKEQYITAKNMVFLGTLIFGAALALVAQIFNLKANWTEGNMLWAIGVIFTAYFTYLTNLYYLGLILCLVSSQGFLFFALFSLRPDITVTSYALLIFMTCFTFYIGKDLLKDIGEKEVY